MLRGSGQEQDAGAAAQATGTSLVVLTTEDLVQHSLQTPIQYLPA
jgi:hypothetical protein